MVGWRFIARKDLSRERNSVKEKPLVSVFMPAYNQESLIGEAIESVLNQTYDNWELIIGDDCSTDDTFKVAESYQRRFPDKIKLFRNPENLGITPNCNKVLKKCSGDFIAFTAGDDLFLPDKLEKQVSMMTNNPKCVFCYHDVDVFESDSGDTIRYWNVGENSSPPVTGDARTVAKALVWQGTAFMAALSVMVRRSAVPSYGYDERVPIASDWLLWIDVCANSDGVVEYAPDVLARYRKHEESITLKMRHDITDQLVTLGLVEARYPWLRDMARRRRGYEFYRQGVNLILNGNVSAGRSQLLVGLKTHLYSWKLFGWWMFSWIKKVPSKV
jgi:glycosyltransferase involved in cell wall biosynthesis